MSVPISPELPSNPTIKIKETTEKDLPDYMKYSPPSSPELPEVSFIYCSIYCVMLFEANYSRLSVVK